MEASPDKSLEGFASSAVVAVVILRNSTLIYERNNVRIDFFFLIKAGLTAASLVPSVESSYRN